MRHTQTVRAVVQRDAEDGCIALARGKAQEALGKVAAGVNPNAEKKAAREAAKAEREIEASLSGEAA